MMYLASHLLDMLVLKSFCSYFLKTIMEKHVYGYGF